jgi:hypothetical protein
VLVVASAALLHPVVPQPDGTVLYELLTGHLDRAPRNWCLWPTSPWSCVPGRPTPGQRRGRPAGGRPRGHRRLAARPAGPAAGQADRPGGPGAGAAGP